MTGKCHQHRDCRRKDKEYNREVEENASQDNDVIQIRTDKSNDPG